MAAVATFSAIVLAFPPLLAVAGEAARVNLSTPLDAGQIVLDSTQLIHTYGCLPAYSPDGSQLAYVMNRKGFFRSEVWVRRSDDKQVRLSEGTLPAWSPDGKTIACLSVSRRYLRKPHLLLVDSETGKFEDRGGVPVSNDSRKTTLEWRDDGKAIAFRGESLYVMTLEDGKIYALEAPALLDRFDFPVEAPKPSNPGFFLFTRKGALYAMNRDRSYTKAMGIDFKVHSYLLNSTLTRLAYGGIENTPDKPDRNPGLWEAKLSVLPEIPNRTYATKLTRSDLVGPQGWPRRFKDEEVLDRFLRYGWIRGSIFTASKDPETGAITGGEGTIKGICRLESLTDEGATFVVTYEFSPIESGDVVKDLKADYDERVPQMRGLGTHVFEDLWYRLEPPSTAP